MKECCKTYLLEQFGDEDLVKELYAEYASSMAEKLSEAEAALAGGDWNQLDRAAHTIKGNAMAAGDDEMAQTAIDLRGASKLSDAAMAGQLIGKIKELAAGL